MQDGLKLGKAPASYPKIKSHNPGLPYMGGGIQTMVPKPKIPGLDTVNQARRQPSVDIWSRSPRTARVIKWPELVS